MAHTGFISNAKSHLFHLDMGISDHCDPNESDDMRYRVHCAQTSLDVAMEAITDDIRGRLDTHMGDLDETLVGLKELLASVKYAIECKDKGLQVDLTAEVEEACCVLRTAIKEKMWTVKYETDKLPATKKEKPSLGSLKCKH